MANEKHGGQRETLWPTRNTVANEKHGGQRETLWPTRNTVANEKHGGQRETRWPTRNTVANEKHCGQRETLWPTRNTVANEKHGGQRETRWPTRNTVANEKHGGQRETLWSGASLRGGCVGCRTLLASEAVGNFLDFVLLSANLETFCFRKYFVGNISRPIRKSTSLPQQRDIEHPLDTSKDGRM